MSKQLPQDSAFYVPAILRHKGFDYLYDDDSMFEHQTIESAVTAGLEFMRQEGYSESDEKDLFVIYTTAKAIRPDKGIMASAGKTVSAIHDR